LALVGQHRDLLATALARVDNPAVRANLKQEMAALANKVVVADALAPDEPESLHQAVDKAAAMVNLGLDLLCDGDPDRATLALAQIYLENLYRCGQTRVTSLRLRLDALLHEGWLRHWPHGLNLFDEPWHEAVDLLMAKTPMLLRQSDGGSAPEDLFRSRTDLAAAEETVTMTEGLEPLFADCRRFWPEGWQQLAHLLLPQGQVHQLNQVTLGTLLLTGAANALRQGTWQTVPLPVASWGETAPLLAPEGMEKILRQHLAELLPDKTAHRAAERYLQPLLLRYREEMGDRHHLPEPQLTPFFLFRAD
ncbi:MAG: DUF6178 family protein, partial [Desulfobulbaceae bacterium]|nr:DUF6178 family protein [Desulfobulbaceae bacterium]